MAGSKLDKVFQKFGDGAHQGQYVTRKELKEILSELAGETQVASTSSSPAPTRRSIG